MSLLPSLPEQYIKGDVDIDHPEGAPMNQPDTQTASQSKSLYKIGGIAALLLVLIIVVQMIVFISAPPPLEGTVTDWFALFQKNSFIGLLDFELLMIVYTLIAIPLNFALYFALKQTNPPVMALYLALSIIGVGAFIAARPAFEMLYLSRQYASAATDVQRSVYMASGETLIAIFHGTAFYVSYVLGSISGLMLSIIMLQSDAFSKTTAYMRLASAVFDFGLFIPGIGTLLSIIAVLLLLVWDILIARRLFQLGRSETNPVVRVASAT
jgi:hypothetical protein